MKRLVLATAVILFASVSGHAQDNGLEGTRTGLVDAYHYGLNGKDCTEIYNGTSSVWSFTSDRGVQDSLYERCKVGEQDMLKGRKELPHVLEKIRNRHISR